MLREEQIELLTRATEAIGRDRWTPEDERVWGELLRRLGFVTRATFSRSDESSGTRRLRVTWAETEVEWSVYLVVSRLLKNAGACNWTEAANPLAFLATAAAREVRDRGLWPDMRCGSTRAGISWLPPRTVQRRAEEALLPASQIDRCGEDGAQLPYAETLTAIDDNPAWFDFGVLQPNRFSYLTGLDWERISIDAGIDEEVKRYVMNHVNGVEAEYSESSRKRFYRNRHALLAAIHRELSREQQFSEKSLSQMNSGLPQE